MHWPTDKKVVTGRFYDYGDKSDGINEAFASKGFTNTIWDKSPYNSLYRTAALGALSHNGSDIRAEKIKSNHDPIYAIADGTICHALGANDGNYPGCRIIISHGNGLYSLYAHMSTTKELVLKRDKQHGDMTGKVTCKYKANTLQSVDGKVISGGDPEKWGEKYGLKNFKVKASNILGVVGYGAKPKVDKDSSNEEPDWGPDEDGKIMASHLHLEIRYNPSEKDKKPDGDSSGWSTAKNIYFLSPEHYFIENKISYKY